MSEKSMMEKVRNNRPRQPDPTPKEQEAWRSFLQMVEEFQSQSGVMNPMLVAELNRLANKGNPLAIRFQERVAAASFKPREANEAPLAPPPPRRLSAVKWGRPKDKRLDKGRPE